MSAQVIARIDQQMEGLNPESTRYQVLVALRKFRAGWVDLGRLLTDVAFGGDYKEWGYEDFEVFCARELGLKKPTVKKLMVSYNYMKSYAPERMERNEADAGYDVPDCQTDALLKKAREREDLKDEEKEELHRLAFEGASEEGALQKEIRGRLRLAGDPGLADKRERLALAKAARQIKRLASGCQVLPDSQQERVIAVAGEVEAIV